MCFCNMHRKLGFDCSPSCYEMPCGSLGWRLNDLSVSIMSCGNTGGHNVVFDGHGTQEVTASNMSPHPHFPPVALIPSGRQAQTGASVAFTPLQSSPTSLYYKEPIELCKGSWTWLILCIASVVIYFCDCLLFMASDIDFALT